MSGRKEDDEKAVVVYQPKNVDAMDTSAFNQTVGQLRAYGELYEGLYPILDTTISVLRLCSLVRPVMSVPCSYR